MNTCIGAGLPVHQLSTFAILADAYRLRQWELQQLAGVSQPVLSRYIRSMRELGIVASHDDPEDHRGKIVALTAKGTKLAFELSHAVSRYLKTSNGKA